jgi:beta-lactamase superfamily II metal-dependent hydrolase
MFLCIFLQFRATHDDRGGSISSQPSHFRGITELQRSVGDSVLDFGFSSAYPALASSYQLRPRDFDPLPTPNMSTIKSFSVGYGDMFYIKHNSNNFTIIDCYIHPASKDEIIGEIMEEKKGKEYVRFISTHPDEDHIGGLKFLDDAIDIANFYCVKNEATKLLQTEGFKRYCALRDDSKKAFYLYRACTRKYMNLPDETTGSAGLQVLWPKTDNHDYKIELQKAKEGTAFNNISIILRYAVEGGPSAIWMGDLETDFMECIKNEIAFEKTNILFMPHHGRKSGKLPAEWMEQIDPDVLIKGEAHSKDSDYVSNPDRNKIHQNRAKDILMELESDKIHFFVSDPDYCVEFLNDERRYKAGYNYIGTLNL